MISAIHLFSNNGKIQDVFGLWPQKERQAQLDYAMDLVRFYSYIPTAVAASVLLGGALLTPLNITLLVVGVLGGLNHIVWAYFAIDGTANKENIKDLTKHMIRGLCEMALVTSPLLLVIDIVYSLKQCIFKKAPAA